MMNADELMQYQYLKMEELQVEESLFFHEKSSIKFGDGKSFYLFFLPKHVKDNHVEYFDRTIMMGEKSKYLFDHLEESNDLETTLDILPRYFVYKNRCYQIVELFLESKEYTIGTALEALMHLQGVTVKCEFLVQGRDVTSQHLEMMRRVLQTLNTDTSLVKTVETKVTLEGVQTYIKSRLLAQSHFFKLRVFLQLEADNEVALNGLHEQVKLMMKLHGFSLKRHQYCQYQLIEQFYLQAAKTSLEKNYLLVAGDALKTDFPLAHLGLCDKGGRHLGSDCHHHPVLLDFWKRNEMRVNSNFLILGQSGQGKTTLAKRILSTANEQWIFIFDPESEYTFSKDDDVAEIVLQEGAMIAELFLIPLDQPFALDFFVQHFAYVTDADFEKQAIFRRWLRKIESLHDRKKVMQSFQTENADVTIVLYIEQLFARPVISLHSNQRIQHFSIHSQMQVLTDTSKLLYYELLAYIWMKLIELDGRKLFLIDEAYLLFQSNDHFLITLIQNMFKRMRKYDGSIGLITQNLGDYANPKHRHALMTIFDNANYQFIFNVQGDDRKELRRLLSFTDEHLQTLDELKRGECLLVCRRSQIGKFKVTKTETFI